MADERKGVLEDHHIEKIHQVARREGFEDFTIVCSSGSTKGDNFLGIIERVKIEGKKKDGKSEVLTVMVKIPPKFEQLRADESLQRLYCREIYAYTDILPAFEKICQEQGILEDNRLMTAKCYQVSTTNLEEILILEDMKQEGFIMHDRLKPLDYDHMMLVIKTIAQCHALSFVAKEKAPNLYKDTDILFIEKDVKEDALNMMLKSSFGKALAVLENDDHKQRLEYFCDTAWDLMHKCYVFEGEINPYQIICHGDCWNNNFLFKYEKNKPSKLLMLDWQIIKYGSPVTDLAYFLYTSCDGNLRNQYWDEIFTTYYETLKENLSNFECDVAEVYPKEAFKQDLEDKLVVGLLWGIILLPLVMGNRDEAVDASDLLKEEGFSLKNVKMSAGSVRRIREIVNEFVEMGLI